MACPVDFITHKCTEGGGASRSATKQIDKWLLETMRLLLLAQHLVLFEFTAYIKGLI